MMIRALISTSILVVVMVILTLCLPLPAFAVSTITATSGGDGVFLLQGTGIEDAAALEITVQYDTASLANPQVVVGPLIAGAMTAINPNISGTVRIVAIRLTPVRGSGVIATMTFDRKGSSSGGITALAARLADLKGSPIPSVASIAPSVAEPASASSSPGTETPSGSTASSAASTGAPTAPTVAASPVLVVPGGPAANVPETPAVSRPSGQDAQPSVPPEAAPAQQDHLAMARSSDATLKGKDATSDASSVADKSVYRQTSILDRFGTYRGERTSAAFIGLFDNLSMIGCRQEPPVALSDGKSAIRFVFVSAPGARTTSDIAVMGAKLLSLTRDPDNTNTWIIDLLPDQGSYQASVAVPLGNLKMIYPLTVAPKIEIKPVSGKTVTKADFERYLKDRRRDLNKDGKLDGLDDYIFTANYLRLVDSTAARQQDPHSRSGR